MDTAKFCQHCGKPLNSKAVHGLCPECFLKVGLGSGAGQGAAPKPGGFAPPRPEELAPHFPQLEILELLGKGGMGAVYKARQKALDRLVALKVLPPDAERDPAFAERFTREAQALARLNHSNIVAVHEFGQAGGYYFFVMEFVDGVNLRQMLRAQRLSPREAMAIVPQICEALQYAHDRGIVHRDIKPENILVDKQGRVKIADFGLAKLLGKGATDEPLTRSADVMGTPQYMAPEQFEKPLEVDHRADIYSLGVVFYEMLTGELPLGRFAAPSQKVHVDVRLDEIVLRALEKEPTLRFQQASQVRSQVETLAAAPPLLGPAPDQPAPEKAGAETPTAGFSFRRVPWPIWIVVILLALEGIGNLLSIPSYSPAIIWVAAKALFITGLLRRWRPVFVVFLFVAGIHVVYFAMHGAAPGAAINLLLMILTGLSFRYYFEGSRREKIGFAIAGAVLLGALVLALPVVLLFLARAKTASRRVVSLSNAQNLALSDQAAATAEFLQKQIASMEFSPVFERTIQFGPAATNQFLDLDTGRFVNPPPLISHTLKTGAVSADAKSSRGRNIFPNSASSLYLDWLAEAGVDLTATDRDALVGFDGTFPVAEGSGSANWNHWEDFAAEQPDATATQTRGREFPLVPKGGIVSSSSTGASLQRPDGWRIDYITRERSPTWFFKTREGAMGVLQIVGTTENPHGVIIRYRLAR